MRRLLFLIADTGGGHRASATAVARQLEADLPGEYRVRLLDPFAEASPRLIGGTASLYGPLTRRGRWLWAALYHATNTRAAVASLNATVLRLVAAGITRAVRALQPDAIVSFHPLLNHAAVRAAGRVKPRPPVLTVVTDLVDVHASWACADVDAVVVPSPGGLDRCRRAGIAADRCHLLGLPVDARFAAGPATAAERHRLRAELGLAGDGFLALLCGGADGSGGIARRARAVAAAPLDLHVAVICGRNARVVAQLRGLRDHRGDAVQVRGFVDDMPRWLRACDVVITKAGPGTIAEALCCGVPLLLTWYLPGQETANVEWVIDTGAGRYVPRVSQLLDTLAELSAPGSPALAAMRRAVRRVAHPGATADIAALIHRLASSP